VFEMTRIFEIIFLFSICHWQIGETNSKNQRVNILSPGILSFEAPGSTLSHYGPAFDTGILRLRQIYPQYEWKLKYLFNEKVTTCNALLENIQDLLSQWYYKERDPTSITVIVTPGK
jgi:hypothetical protein